MPFKNNEAKCTTCGQEYFMVKVQMLPEDHAVIKIVCANEDCTAHTKPYSLFLEGKTAIQVMQENFK